MFEFEDSESLIDLVRAAQAGSEEALARLIEQHRSRIRFWAYGILGDWTEAEDIVQEVSVRAWQRLEQLTEPGAVTGWLRTITCRLAYSLRSRKSLHVDGDLTAAERMESRELTSLDSLLTKDTQLAVQQGLERLKSMDRRTLVAFYIDEMSIQEMAVAFDAPLGTIKRRLHVARNRLAQQIQSSNSV